MTCASFVVKGFRPHGHGLHVFLERVGFFKSVLDTSVERKSSPHQWHTSIFDRRQALFVASPLRLWEMVVVCCKWSCIVRKAFVTRCRKTCPGFCVGLSPRSCRIPSKHCSTLLPSGGSLPLGVAGRAAFADRVADRDAQRRSNHTSKVCFLFLFFLTLISLLYRLAMSLLALPTDQLVFVKLNVSMPCDTPRWRLLVSCPCLPFIFRSQAAGASHDSPRAQTCTSEGPDQNTTKIPREDTQREGGRSWGRAVRAGGLAERGLGEGCSAHTKIKQGDRRTVCIEFFRGDQENPFGDTKTRRGAEKTFDGA